MAYTRNYGGRGGVTNPRLRMRADGGMAGGGTIGGGMTDGGMGIGSYPPPNDQMLGGKPSTNVNPDPRVPPYIKSGPQTPAPRRFVTPWRGQWMDQLVPNDDQGTAPAPSMSRIWK